MNMNMKNEKTMLALVLVAALAMVSVAGVALASESDAAAEVTSGSTYTVQNDTTNIGVEITIVNTNNTTFIVPSGLTYNGTVSIGTKDSTGTYTALYSVTFTNTTNVTVAITTTGTYTITQTSTSSAVDVTVGKNTSVAFGNYTADSKSYGFNGKVTSAGSEFTFANVYSDSTTPFVLSNVDGNAVISGVLVLADGNKPVTTPAWSYEDDFYASLTISGSNAVYFKNVTIPANVELIVADGATLMNYGSGNSGYVDVTLTVASTVSGSNQYAYAIDSQENVIVGTFTGTTVTFVGLSLTEKYDVYTYNGDSDDSGKKYTSGVIDFTATSVYTSSTAGTTTATILGGVTTGTTTADVKYSAETVTSAMIIVDGKVISGTIDTTNKVIKFDVPMTAKNYPCMIAYTNSAAFEYIGYLNVTLHSESTTTVDTAIADTTDDKVTTLGSEKPSLSYLTNTLTIGAEAKLTVNGNVTITNTYGNGIIALNTGSPGSTVNFGEKGIIESKTAITQPAAGTVDGWNGINGASYSKTVTVNSISTTTYYYTTLKNAMTNSDNITVLGYLVITEDLNLTGTATTEKNKITFNGTLVIGSEDTSAVVTLLSTTTATYSNATSINVINGKYVTVGSVREYSQIASDAFLKAVVEGGNNGIFTDLATALDESVSGDTVTLRQSANLSKTATVKEGVTLDAKNTYSVTVKAGAKLTIVGTAKFAEINVDEKSAAIGAIPAKAAGILNINSNNVTFITANIAGVVNMGASDLKLTSGTINIESIDSKNPVIFNITGTVTSNGVLVGSSTASSYVIWNISGTFNNLVTGTTNATGIYTTMNVTGTYVAMNAQWIAELTVTGNGSVTCKSTGYAITVSDMLIVGVETKDIAANTNNATVVVTLGDSAVAYVYGNFDDEKIIVTATNSAAFIIKGNTYCTIYGTPANNMSVSNPTYFMYKPIFTNYTLVAWYSDESLDTIVTSTPTTADGAKYYAEVEGKTFTVTLTYVQNGNWIVNDRPVSSGAFPFTFGDDNTISFTVADGYTWTGKILVNGNEMPANYTPKADDVFTVSAEPVEKETPAAGMDLVTILLIIITIVIVIMAIIIALKLMRS